jgi:hypothetical protein
MMETDSTNNPGLNRMAEINEALLKSKGRLQNEIIALKRQIEEHVKNQKVITEQANRITELESLLTVSKEETAVLMTEKNELAQQLKHALEHHATLVKEMERLRYIKWYQKLLGKK